MPTIKCTHFKTDADVEATCISKCAFCRRPGKNRQCPDLAAYIEANEAECATILLRVSASKPFREAFPVPSAEGVAAARRGISTRVVAVKPTASPSGCSPYAAKQEDIEDTKPERIEVPAQRIDESIFPTLRKGTVEELVPPTPLVDVYEPVSKAALESIKPCPPKEIVATFEQPKKREKGIRNSFVLLLKTAPGSGLFSINDIDVRDLVTYTMAGRRVIAAPEATEF